MRCAIVTGAGDKAFAAGADIAAMASMTPQQAKHFADLGHRVGAALEALHFPVIAAVNGFALGGGCELALACDFIYASDKAKLGQPEVNLGVIPGFGGTQRLARRVGDARARELCMTGDMVGAEEALRIGLVNAVVPHAELLPRGARGRQEDRQQGTARHRRRQARHRPGGRRAASTSPTSSKPRPSRRSSGARTSARG